MCPETVICCMACDMHCVTYHLIERDKASSLMMFFHLLYILFVAICCQ